MNKDISNFIIGQRIQEKFEFYVIALVFTILGFSIQTAALGESITHAILEIIAWLCLLISGLAGLSRLEWIPILYTHAHESDTSRSVLTELNASKASGEEFVMSSEKFEKVPINRPIKVAKEKIEKHDSEIEMIFRKHMIKYHVHKWAFVGGMAFLVFSRICKGLDPFLTKN